MPSHLAASASIVQVHPVDHLDLEQHVTSQHISG